MQALPNLAHCHCVQGIEQMTAGRPSNWRIWFYVTEETKERKMFIKISEI